MNNPVASKVRAEFIFTNSEQPITDAGSQEHRHYWLPEDCSPAELQAVKDADIHGGPKQWLAALVELAMKEKNLTEESAVEFCLHRYPRIVANCT